MVAVTHDPPTHRPRGLEPPRLVVVRSRPTVARPPVALPAATYRRRRAAAAAVVLTVVLALTLAVHALLAVSSTGGGPARDRPAVTGPVHVVQPGDTFWDIARSLRPDDDPRPLVARLVAAHHGPVLVVGERIPLPPA